MKVDLGKVSIHIDTTYYQKDSRKPHLLFIHGFTGSSEDWGRIIPEIHSGFSKLAIDLIGHGQSSSPVEAVLYSTSLLIQTIDEVLKQLGVRKIIPVGYSMGGRAALNFVINYPQKNQGLILESSTAGINHDHDKKERIDADKKLSKKIKKDGIEKFIEYWLNLPLFESQKNLPASIRETIRKNKLNNNPIGLTNTLLSFSTGVMPSLWNGLLKIQIPVKLITGEHDAKYNRINQEMMNALNNAEHSIVAGSGHNVHLEKPTEFIILVNRYLRTFFN